MRIRLQYYSIYRNLFGKEEMAKDYPDAFSIRDIFISHFQEVEKAERHLKFTRFAVNAEYVGIEVVLKDGDELVFIPPVSGG